MKYLLSKGADPNLHAKNDSHSPLECAALFGDTETLFLLLARSPTKEVKCSSALLHAASLGATDKMDVLLAAGAEIDGIPDNERLVEWHFENRQWGTALHVAVAHGQISSIEYLLEKGAGRDVRNPVGVTPRELAVELGHGEAVELLSA